MKKIILSRIYLIINLLSCCCAVSMGQSNSQQALIKYENSSRMKITRDLEADTDKHFIIQMPRNWKQHRVAVSSWFTHTFEFDNDQTMIVVYYPQKKEISKGLGLNLTYSKFSNWIEGEKISSILKRAKIKKNLLFGYCKYPSDKIVVLYINATPKAVSQFNDSIQSLQVKN